MAYKTVTQIFNECFDDTNNALKVKITVNDDKLLKIGTDADSVILNRSTSLSANTALANVIVGTPDTEAIVANSLVISNTTQDADIHIIGNDGGNSQTFVWIDTSDYIVYFPERASFLGDTYWSTVLQANLNAASISSWKSTDGYTTIQAYDTGVGLVEVARFAGAADPYFSMGGSQNIRGYNSGKFALVEQAAALTDVAGEGQIWVKNSTPNTLYFTDDTGVDYPLAAFDVHNGEMVVTSNQTAVIETANTPHAFTGFSTGVVSDFTFNAGITGAITAYADYSGTVAGTVLATADTHGLTTGDIITIRGTTNYNGVFEVTVVDANTFYFTDTWVADDGASDFEMGDYLLAGTGTAGQYDIEWNSSVAEGGAAGGTVTFQVYINTAVQTKAGGKRKFANNDVGSISGGGHITIAESDRIWFAHQSDSTNDLTVGVMNLRLNRL